jgi:ribonuclease VapC
VVVDTSALLAILFDEPERHHFNGLIVSAPVKRISSGTYLETAIVMEARNGHPGMASLKLFLSSASIEISVFDDVQARIAAVAYSSYGKGRHPAALNFGDCMSYALSKEMGEPLLFKGYDFSKTDIISAIHG